MQFPPVSRHIIPLRSKYSPQHPVLKHPQTAIYTDQNSTRNLHRSISQDIISSCVVYRVVFSRVVTRHGVRIGSWIYWTLKTRNYRKLWRYR
jgi:hypothetical protein